MRKILLPAVIGLIFLPINAQVNNNQVPLSWWNKVSAEIPVLELTKPDVENLILEDFENAKQGKAFRVGIMLETSAGPGNNGKWEFVENGKALWRMKVHCADAFGLDLYFTDLAIPDGGKLFVYSEDRSLVAGPYGPDDVSDDNYLGMPLLNGATVIVEYNQDINVTGKFALELDQVMYAYKSEALMIHDTKDFGDSESCQVNVNCNPEGNNWQDQKRSSARILLVDGGFGYICSGAMLNNTLQDCTPYFLTAQHCGAGATHSEFRQWSFYFNYEAPGCPDPASQGTLASQFVTGCVPLAASHSGGTLAMDKISVSTVTKSDFLLVVLRNRPSTAFNAYLSGWNANNVASSSGVGIHHPSGDIKKISTYTSSLATTTYPGGASSGHWRVVWSSTSNGHGVTEGGSSGSPIYNSSKQVCGQLTGGSSFCTSPTAPDAYGKLSYSWQSAGTSSDRQLKPWLDRNSSGSTTQTGKENNCAAGTLPSVEFVADNVWVVPNQTVTLTDLSTQNPFYWRWIFSPNTYTYVNGTTAYSQNPQVQFTNVGNYQATLYAVNSAGYAYKTKNAYIHVGYVGIEEEESNENAVAVYPNPPSGSFTILVNTSVFDFEKLSLNVQDIQGKFIHLEQSPKVFGNLIQLNLPADISSGVYFLNLYDSQIRVTERIQVIR